MINPTAIRACTTEHENASGRCLSRSANIVLLLRWQALRTRRVKGWSFVDECVCINARGSSVK
eukprot:92139-Pleurochrysis_carterae.AAC.1